MLRAKWKSWAGRIEGDGADLILAADIIKWETTIWAYWKSRKRFSVQQLWQWHNKKVSDPLSLSQPKSWDDSDAVLHEMTVKWDCTVKPSTASVTATP